MSMREDFEKMVASDFENPVSIDRDGDGYQDSYVDSAWWGYKAALSQPAAVEGCAPWIDMDEMVNRFLCWKLPEDFYPDAGVTFNPTELQKIGTHPWPTGTNLLHAVQARAMLEYVLQGQPVETMADMKAKAQEYDGLLAEGYVSAPTPLLDKNDQTEGEIDRLIDQRDNAEEWADRLANAALEKMMNQAVIEGAKYGAAHNTAIKSSGVGDCEAVRAIVASLAKSPSVGQKGGSDE
jgi:hypothetical protein